ncbi:MAG: PQQ-dependent sugar dehydrogenase [Luteolibacter sp.]
MKTLSLLIPLISPLLVGFASAAEVPAANHFKVETLAEGFVDAMEMTLVESGDIFIVERTGALKWYSPKSGEVKEVAQFEVSVLYKKKKEKLSRETGLLGITADPNFMKNGWVYCYYSPKDEELHRLSRFTFKAGELLDEKLLLSIPQSRENGVCHEGGSLAFDGEGNLFLSTGDNSNPFAASGYPPLDEREGNESVNSQRSAGNTNDLRGKVLRIRPTDDGGYDIPEGNLFPVGTAKTRPEIFVMGCRNPWRIGVDKRTNTVYWGDVGPDARKDTPRGPNGYCEINQAAEAGNYGWPYFIADNKAYAAYDFETEKVGEKFDPKAPQNFSRLNTGLKDLPAAKGALWSAPRSCYCAGPVYYSGDYPESAGKLPKEMDSCLITYDWNNGRMQLTKLNEKGDMEWKEDFLKGKKFIHPSDVEIGADGVMYVLEYGSGWYDSNDGKLKKVTYSTTELAETDGEEADARLAGLDMKHPGTILLADATCLSCHQTQAKSVGPRYVDVAARYKDVDGAQKLLSEKILKGGVGVWGDIPMPPNPQYSEEQLSQMVDAILSLDTGGHKE